MYSFIDLFIYFSIYVFITVCIILTTFSIWLKIYISIEYVIGNDRKYCPSMEEPSIFDVWLKTLMICTWRISWEII